jgi:hypothetical protein
VAIDSWNPFITHGVSDPIEWSLIFTNYATLRDSAHRRALSSEMANLPFDNLWLRISGFGADASGVGVRRYISSVADFHGVGKPIVADCVGGLAGLAVASFGAVTHVDRRIDRFLDHHLTIADRVARQAAKLNVGDEGLEKVLKNASLRLDRVCGVLEDLDSTLGPEASRAEAIRTRPTAGARQKQQGS